jgi:hypothetical protein
MSYKDDAEFKKLKCGLCGKTSFVLIQVQLAGEMFNLRHQGICYSCFKEGEIDQKLFFKNEEYCMDQVRDASDRLKFWKKEYSTLKRNAPRKKTGK